MDFGTWSVSVCASASAFSLKINALRFRLRDMKMWKLAHLGHTSLWHTIQSRTVIIESYINDGSNSNERHDIGAIAR